MVDRIALNVTAASDRVSSIAVNGAEVGVGEWSAPVPLHFGTTSISVVVVAGRYDAENVYTVPAFRPAASNPNLESLDVVDETYHKHAAPNLTGVPRPVPPCELHDAAARAAVGLAFHPACDDPSESAARRTTRRRRTGVRTGDRSVDRSVHPHAAASGARREWREDGASVRRRVGVVGGCRGGVLGRGDDVRRVRLGRRATSPVSTTIGPSTSSTWTIERRACF